MSLLPIFCTYRIIMSAYFWCEDFSRVGTFNGLLPCESILLRVSKGPSISGNLCPKLDVQDFEKEEGQSILPALLVVTTLSCGSVDDVDMARMAKLSPIRSHSL